MARLEDLEKAIAALTADEFREFRRWFLDRDWEQWDRQIEEDARAGELDFLVKEAFEDKKQGKIYEAPGNN